MLLIKPNCEWCDVDLLPDSIDARICSYECTFCANCVETVLGNVCPNCGGGFCQRPIRPHTAYRSGVSRAHHPPSTERVSSPYTESEVTAFANSLRRIDPVKR